VKIISSDELDGVDDASGLQVDDWMCHQEIGGIVENDNSVLFLRDRRLLLGGSKMIESNHFSELDRATTFCHRDPLVRTLPLFRQLTGLAARPGWQVCQTVLLPGLWTFVVGDDLSVLLSAANVVIDDVSIFFRRRWCCSRCILGRVGPLDIYLLQRFHTFDVEIRHFINEPGHVGDVDASDGGVGVDARHTRGGIERDERSVAIRQERWTQRRPPFDDSLLLDQLVFAEQIRAIIEKK